MLILTRRLDEVIQIGEDIIVKVVTIRRGVVRIGIDAPKHVRVDKLEIRERLVAELEGQGG